MRREVSVSCVTWFNKVVLSKSQMQMNCSRATVLRYFKGNGNRKGAEKHHGMLRILPRGLPCLQKNKDTIVRTMSYPVKPKKGCPLSTGLNNPSMEKLPVHSLSVK